MANLNENAITKLSTTTGVDMKTAASTLIYTVPTGKTLIISHVTVRTPSATLAGGTSYGVTNFRAGVDLSSMTTATTDSMTIRGADVTKYTVSVAGTAIYFVVTTGSTGAATAVIDLFGYLY